MADSQADTLLVQYLAERDVPCPVCKYNLRGLTAEKCPECGSALKVELTAHEPKTSGWLLAAFGWSGLAFALLFATVEVGIDIGAWPDPIELVVLAAAAGVAILFSAVGFVLLSRPAWFFRSPACGDGSSRSRRSCC